MRVREPGSVDGEKLYLKGGNASLVTVQSVMAEFREVKTSP